VLVIPKVLDGELLQAQGLGLTEYSVLMNLSEQPGRSMRMSELANAVMISASGLTRVVERLTRQGLAERVKADTDGRGQLAALTPAGLARLEQAYPTLLAAVREHLMDHLADLDLAAFTHAMSGIVRLVRDWTQAGLVDRPRKRWRCRTRLGQVPSPDADPRRRPPWLGWGWSPNGPNTPPSIRSDCRTANALSKVKTSAAASLPRYFWVTGAAV
jgi:DNA-binding MarR family transcriptional regulator